MRFPTPDSSACCPTGFAALASARDEIVGADAIGSVDGAVWVRLATGTFVTVGAEGRFPTGGCGITLGGVEGIPTGGFSLAISGNSAASEASLVITIRLMR